MELFHKPGHITIPIISVFIIGAGSIDHYVETVILSSLLHKHDTKYNSVRVKTIK